MTSKMLYIVRSLLFPCLWVIALVALLLPLPAIALPGEEETPPQKIHQLSLADIIKIGLEVSPKLWEQRSVIDQAEAQLGQAKAGRLPRMDYLQIAGLIPEAKGNATYSPSNRSDLLTGLGPFTRLEIKINQPLYTFGKGN